MRFRKAILALAASAFCFLASGQEREKWSLYNWMWDLISAPSRSYDPSAVYQPAACWRVAVTGDLKRAGVSQRNEFKVGSTFPAYTYSELKGGIDKAIGLQVGYGNLSLGYSQKVGGVREYVNKAYSFDYMFGGAALRLNYLDFRQPIEYEMRVGDPGDLLYQEQAGQTDNVGRMRAFMADVLYSFNNRTFAYSAVYKGTKIQRHSAGTWMLGTKFIQGMVENDPGENLSSWLSGIASQSTCQVSIGGGYSYNLVPYHRQPSGEGWEGFRNLTFNLTAVPMVTLFNRFSSVLYEPDPNGGFKEGRKSVMKAQSRVNYVVRAGGIYSWNNYYVSLTGTYDSFSYFGKTSLEYAGTWYKGVVSTGRFFRWTTELLFCVKF